MGQGYTLEIAVPEGPITDEKLEDIGAGFHGRHEALYGFRAEGEPVEIVNLRVQATGALERLSLVPQDPGPRDPAAAETGQREAWVEAREAMARHRLYDRARLAAGHVLVGPAIVEQDDSTTVIPPDWVGAVDGFANLIIGTEEWAHRG